MFFLGWWRKRLSHVTELHIQSTAGMSHYNQKKMTSWLMIFKEALLARLIVADNEKDKMQTIILFPWHWIMLKCCICIVWFSIGYLFIFTLFLELEFFRCQSLVCSLLEWETFGTLLTLHSGVWPAVFCNIWRTHLSKTTCILHFFVVHLFLF